MIKLLIFIFISLAALPVVAQNNLHIYQVDPLEKVFKERAYFTDVTDTIFVAAGETASLQFVVKAGNEIRNLSAKVLDVRNGSAKLTGKTGWVTYVPLGRSYYPASRDIIRSVSGYFPDPIVDDTTLNLIQGEINPLWISVPVPVSSKAGMYKGTVKVEGIVNNKKMSFNKDFFIKVYPVIINKTSLLVTNWSSHYSPVSLALLNRGKRVELYTPLYYELLKVYADMMVSHNQNVQRIFPIWNTQYTLSKGKYTFDFSHFDKEVEIFQAAGDLDRIEGGHLAWRADGWDGPFSVEVPVEDNEANKNLPKSPNPTNTVNGIKFVLLPISDERAKSFLDQFLPALNLHLEQKGWLKKYIQHIGDEPTTKNSASYVEISSYVKKHLPSVKILDAVLTSKELRDGIDIWVTLLDVFHKDYAFYQELKKAGKEIWFYTCSIPRENYANRFIELPLIQTRYLHWINFKYGATGYLHWGLNYWGGLDPLRDDASRDNGRLPAGDANIVYPGYKKLYSSIRYEAMRDGIYDYELLKMLEKKDSIKSKKIVDNLILNFDEYDNSIHYFRKIRKQILEELSK